MKTTVDVPDSLFKRLRQRAARDGTTMRASIHAALQNFPAGSDGRAAGFKLKDGAFHDDGRAAGAEDWSDVRERLRRPGRHAGFGRVNPVDNNILVCAHRADSPWHDRARECLRAPAEDRPPWMIPWPCIYEFLAIVTHARIFKTPTPLDAALEQVQYRIESPSLILQSESPSHWLRVRELAVRRVTSGPAMHDARVAAVCIDAGVSMLYSADRDFQRLPALKVVNPLLA